MTLDAAPGGAAVTTTGLTKRFGDRTVVDGLDLSIPTASVCGFVGANGAGKTTTIRMLLGLIRPSSGGGTILGGHLGSPESYLSQVGALIEAPAFYPQLSGGDNLLALSRLGSIPKTVIPEVLDRVGLAERSRDRYGRYSLGMKQRMGIAAALLSSPSLLILDEPTNGLDPTGILEMRGLIRSLASDGTTIFVSSHLLGEIEHICDHLIMIRDGRTVFQGSVEQLRSTDQSELVMRPEDPKSLDTLARLVADRGLQVHIEEASSSIVVANGVTHAGDLNRMAMEADVTICHLAGRRRSLEDAYFALSGTRSGNDIGVLGGIK